jgi:hypothetical protein
MMGSQERLKNRHRPKEKNRIMKTTDPRTKISPESFLICQMDKLAALAKPRLMLEEKFPTNAIEKAKINDNTNKTNNLCANFI